MRLLLLSVSLLFSTLTYAQVSFEEQASQLGCNASYGFGFLGGGISFYDYNKDGLDDLTISSASGQDVYFYKNVGGSFERENVVVNGGDIQTKQVIWVDYDNDDDLDFFAASDEGLSRLYNNDNGTFTDVTDSCGFPSETYKTFGGAWGDYNNDGFLDVFFTIRDNAQIDPNLLFKNNGDGTFTDVTIEAGLETSGYLSFCAVFFDYDKDGYQDIYMANDKYGTENIMYHNNGDGTFENVSEATGTDLVMGAMSTTIDDYNNDGWLDIYISNDEQVIDGATVGNAFLKNNGDGTFTNVAVETGTQFNSVGWGCVFLDADNDMDHDLYVSGTETGDIPDLLPSAFYENQGDGTFVIPDNIGFENDVLHSYSNAIGDVDNDGYPEIAVLNERGDDIFIWKNTTTTTNNWLKVGLVGNNSNKQGIGSWIEISANNQVQYHYTLCGEGYLGQNSDKEFFGLSDATIVDYVKVTWLSGTIDYLENVAINQVLTIEEGSSPLSVDEFQSENLKLYPNPANEVLHIDLLENIGTPILIYDATGKKVLESKQTSKLTSIPISDLQTGMYFVKVGEHIQQLIKK